MGTVYVGRALGMGGFERLVAVKLLHRHLADQEHFVTMFLDEARLAAQIYHPNVVATLDVFEAEGNYCLAMEYVRGLELSGLLRAALRRRERIPAPVILRVVLDALQGLSAAHSLRAADGSPLNLVHRDVSPQNILIGADGISRLTDFGVARAEHRLSTTRSGEFKGKTAYAAPEQLEHSTIEQRSDLFAMGVVLWEALAHRRLFQGEDKFALIRSVLEDPVPALADLDARLAPVDAVLACALQKDRDSRYASAEQMLAALQEASSRVGVSSPANVGDWVKRIGGERIAEVEEAVRDAQSSVEVPLDVSSGELRLSSSVTPPPPQEEDEEDVPTVVARPTDEVSQFGPLGSAAELERRAQRRVLWTAVVVAVVVALVVSTVAIVALRPAGETERPTSETRPAETRATETRATEMSATETRATETSATETSATETSATETSATEETTETGATEETTETSDTDGTGRDGADMEPHQPPTTEPTGGLAPTGMGTRRRVPRRVPRMSPAGDDEEVLDNPYRQL